MKLQRLARWALTLLPALLLLSGQLRAAGDGGGSILVVADKSVAAYREAAESLKRGLVELGDTVVETTPDAAARALNDGAGGVKLAVAIGADARAALGQAQTKLPVVSAMLSIADLSSEKAPPSKLAGAVYLDLDFAQVAQEVSRLFPAKKRLGLIVNSRTSGPNKQILSRLAKDGFTVQIAVSPNRAGLLEAFREIKNKVDLVVCLPETGLFDSRTIPALLRQSLEEQVPVVGFSPSFVKAGAIAGVFPDYSDIGQQTAEVVRRAMAAPASQTEGGDETPRKVTSITNPTVMRLLGWKQGQ